MFTKHFACEKYAYFPNSKNFTGGGNYGKKKMKALKLLALKTAAALKWNLVLIMDEYVH